MPEKNEVLELLEDILKSADSVVLFVNQKAYKLSDPTLPPRKAVAFIKSQLNALVPPKASKEEAAA